MGGEGNSECTIREVGGIRQGGRRKRSSVEKRGGHHKKKKGEGTKKAEGEDEDFLKSIKNQGGRGKNDIKMRYFKREGGYSAFNRGGKPRARAN